MKSIKLIAIICSVTAVCAAAHFPDQRAILGPGGCLGPDSTATRLVARLQFLEHASDSGNRVFRTNTQMEVAPDSAIVLVTDSASCAKAVKAYNTLFSDSVVRTSAVYLIRTGQQYVAMDPTLPAGEWGMYALLDSTFALKSRYYY